MCEGVPPSSAGPLGRGGVVRGIPSEALLSQEALLHTSSVARSQPQALPTGQCLAQYCHNLCVMLWLNQTVVPGPGIHTSIFKVHSLPGLEGPQRAPPTKAKYCT